MSSVAASSTSATSRVASSVQGSWRDVIELLKLRIDALIVCVALAAAAAAGTTRPQTIVVLAAACFLASAGASAVNHYVDRERDARMERTRRRPLPSGRIAEARLALGLGVALVAASQVVALPLLGLGPALYLLAGALTYAVVYSVWLKERTPLNIVWGGAAGSFAALAGWQTGGSTWAPAPLVLAGVLLLWTPSHFWSLGIALEDDYRRAGVPMLPVVAGAERTARAVLANSVMLALFSVFLGAYAGWPYLAIAVPANAWFLVESAALAREAGPKRAWRVFKLSGLYLLLVLVALVLSAVVR